MDRIELALIVTGAGMLAVLALAAGLVRGIWVGRHPQFLIVGPSSVMGVLAIGLLATLRPSIPTTMVAGAAAASAPCPGAVGQIVHVSEYGERARLAGIAPLDNACLIWAAIEDPRTGTLWLQGPALVQGQSWTLNLVLGSGPEVPTPLSYRVTVFAVDDQTSADWTAVARGRQQPLELAAIPAPESWLAVALPLGPLAAARGA